MTGPAASSDRLLDILLTATDDDAVDTIIDCITQRVDAQRPRRGTLSEPAQMLIAGSISVRILAAGVLDWARRVNDTTVCVDMREPGKTKVFSLRTQHASRILVLRPDGSEAVYHVDTAPSEVAADLDVHGHE
jgi:hypothetical protein